MPHRSPALAPCGRTAPIAAAWLAGAVVASLVGCASAPPVSAPAPPPPAAARPDTPPARKPPPATAASITAPQPGAAAAPAPADSVALPYSAAVAARFPEPPVSYRTPAFAPGRTQFTSNDELAALLRTLERSSRGAPNGPRVRLLPLGSSQAGVPIEALHFSRAAEATAGAPRPARATVLLVGQQHGDEPAGSEALMVIAQELAQGRLQSLLERIDVIVLPRANPDGAFAGRRVTASGLDVNRDHLLLKTPEAQAQASLVREYAPVVVVDAHEYTVIGRYLEKFGTVQRFDALVQYAMVANLPELLTKASEEWFRQPLLRALQREGLTTEWYYTTPTDLADKRVSMGGVQPDTGRNVNGLRNAVSILVETRGVGLGRTHLARRVHTHVTALTSVLQSTAERADDLLRLRQFVAGEVSAQACRGEAVVLAAATPSEKDLLMLDPVTGADRAIAVSWDSSLVLQPVKTRPRPCGYWLAEDQADAVTRLRGLGVAVQQFAAKSLLRAESYRELAREVGAREDVRGSIADGAGVLRLQVETLGALIDARPGSYYVSLEQPLANLVIAALEPDTQNSYLASRIVTALDRQARVMVRPEGRLTELP